MGTMDQRRGSDLAGRASIMLCALALGLGGCATPKAPVTPDPVRLALERSLASNPDLSDFTKSEESKAAPAVITGDAITIRGYIGTAQDILGKVARARGMKFTVTGPEPRLPLLVTVDVENAKFEDFLSDVSLQFGGRAKVVLGDDRIEIRYSGV
jgi:defect-in-organelle-trafficking protein DotD